MAFEETLHGESGDDQIWGGSYIATDLRAYGGSGNDDIVGGYKTQGNTFLYGNSGKDVVTSAWYRDRDGITANAYGNEYLFGDYKYGGDALDKDLWGDADRIYGGYGAGSDLQFIYAGDGDDYVVGGENWYGSLIELQNGDDTVVVPQLVGLEEIPNNDGFYGLLIRGGAGDDTWRVTSYGDVDEDGSSNFYGFHFGNEGNDYIQGTHMTGL